jgi:hypothetical protein
LTLWPLVGPVVGGGFEQYELVDVARCHTAAKKNKERACDIVFAKTCLNVKENRGVTSVATWGTVVRNMLAENLRGGACPNLRCARALPPWPAALTSARCLLPRSSTVSPGQSRWAAPQKGNTMGARRKGGAREKLLNGAPQARAYPVAVSVGTLVNSLCCASSSMASALGLSLRRTRHGGCYYLSKAPLQPPRLQALS